MRYIFNFPDIGEGLEEGTILEWYVVKGQVIKAGQALVNMETDKIVTDIPSPKAGTIVAIYGNVGETIHVGSPLVEIEIEGVFGAEAVKEANKPVLSEPIEEAAGVVGTMELADKNAYLASSDEGSSKQKAEEKPITKVLATPLARAMAKDRDIDINKVIGSGPSGRVTKEDILNYVPTKHSSEAVQKVVSFTQALPPDAVTYEPLTQIRKTIARNMLYCPYDTLRGNRNIRFDKYPGKTQKIIFRKEHQVDLSAFYSESNRFGIKGTPPAECTNRY
jgi:pyruvate dehydrogenase E2 component (dihydrolipoamide acetyltransferase)